MENEIKAEKNKNQNTIWIDQPRSIDTASIIADLASPNLTYPLYRFALS